MVSHPCLSSCCSCSNRERNISDVSAYFIQLGQRTTASLLSCWGITAARSCGDAERKEGIANCKTDRRFAETTTLTAALNTLCPLTLEDVDFWFHKSPIHQPQLPPDLDFLALYGALNGKNITCRQNKSLNLFFGVNQPMSSFFRANTDIDHKKSRSLKNNIWV